VSAALAHQRETAKSSPSVRFLPRPTTFQSISAYGKPPVLRTMIAQGQLNHPVFTFKLAQNENGSELSIGGVNPALYIGEFTYRDSGK
jgi:Eukaryotic aspartyl protease